MTKMFKLIQENFEGEDEKEMNREVVNAVSLYQIATSLIEIDKDLKNIAAKLEKISGRI